jgi:hypothetical protein
METSMGCRRLIQFTAATHLLDGAKSAALKNLQLIVIAASIHSAPL